MIAICATMSTDFAIYVCYILELSLISCEATSLDGNI